MVAGASWLNFVRFAEGSLEGEDFFSSVVTLNVRMDGVVS